MCSEKESKNTSTSPQLNLGLTGASSRTNGSVTDLIKGWDFPTFLTVIEVCCWFFFFFSPLCCWAEGVTTLNFLPFSRGEKNQLKKREGKNEFLHHWCWLLKTGFSPAELLQRTNGTSRAFAKEKVLSRWWLSLPCPTPFLQKGLGILQLNLQLGVVSLTFQSGVLSKGDFIWKQPCRAHRGQTHSPYEIRMHFVPPANLSGESLAALPANESLSRKWGNELPNTKPPCLSTLVLNQKLSAPQANLRLFSHNLWEVELLTIFPFGGTFIKYYNQFNCINTLEPLKFTTVENTILLYYIKCLVRSLSKETKTRGTGGGGLFIPT